MIDVAAGVKIATSTVHLAKEIAAMTAKAKASPNVVTRVVTYLQSAQAAVRGLAQERQEILAQVRECNPADAKQVSAAASRLSDYLHKDRISPYLQASIDGLRGCRQALENQTGGIRWRKRDKKAAV